MQKLCPASHVIEWNKRMEKHCHHYDYWGERGSFSHLDDTFNRHCNLGLSCPRTSIANDFMKPFARRCGAALSPVPCPLGLLTGTCWASGPHLDCDWESRWRPGELRLPPVHMQARLRAHACPFSAAARGAGLDSSCNWNTCSEAAASTVSVSSNSSFQVLNVMQVC